jgi:Fe2+ transport system protein B
MASLVAALGLFVIPARRRKATSELKEKISALREQLVNSLKGQFEREIERSLQHINEAIAPYTRFVRAERTKLMETQTRLDGIKQALDQLKVKVDEI